VIGVNLANAVGALGLGGTDPRAVTLLQRLP